MDPVTIGLIAGLGKSMLLDKPKEDRQRKLAATQAMYSPWTGIKPDAVQEADMAGSALQGAALGAQHGQAQKADQLADANLDYLKAKTAAIGSPYGGIPNRAATNYNPGQYGNIS